MKDIVNRYKVLQGHKVLLVYISDCILPFFVLNFFFTSYRPGWDCHGLPIELKALEQIRVSFTALYPISACLLYFFLRK